MVPRSNSREIVIRNVNPPRLPCRAWEPNSTAHSSQGNALLLRLGGASARILHGFGYLATVPRREFERKLSYSIRAKDDFGSWQRSFALVSADTVVYLDGCASGSAKSFGIDMRRFGGRTREAFTRRAPDTQKSFSVWIRAPIFFLLRVSKRQSQARGCAVDGLRREPGNRLRSQLRRPRGPQARSDGCLDHSRGCVHRSAFPAGPNTARDQRRVQRRFSPAGGSAGHLTRGQLRRP